MKNNNPGSEVADVSASSQLLNFPAVPSPSGPLPPGPIETTDSSQTTKRGPEWVVELMGDIDEDTGEVPDYDCATCRAEAFISRFGYDKAEGIVSLGTIGGVSVVLGDEELFDWQEWAYLSTLNAAEFDSDSLVTAYNPRDKIDEVWLEKRMELVVGRNLMLADLDEYPGEYDNMYPDL